MDETNFNLWATRTRCRSLRGRRAVKKVFAGGGQNMHVIACICEHGLILSGVVLVLDNAPCHCRAVAVFEETEFLDAKLLCLGPYSPMLNPIEIFPNENVFSTFKSAMKAFMTNHRMGILDVPAGVTMKDHRQSFLQTAAHRYPPQVTTVENCQASLSHHGERSPGHTGRDLILASEACAI
ncbi:hypothetical protein PHYSODRAFT_490273 [Phytophthora sojae]|uniref:Tc1-like transposase DDE domain-containing protein n=1 Tax=Phytophthora sojae (strain P6497) TaxID=1094619 RepID=G4Z2I7_PHYSP|nr:hypothetical protein PHYSODRAFT_490273 [Phytophthora sojae]EGZ20028.1 hypothetical protein PHYSODRAFT_490273 [Phytophthora sojae]|eukprot:XP_009522745.1 hypothetical protein PHYSODRAFT_490273 [Phytophthora sojae]